MCGSPSEKVASDLVLTYPEVAILSWLSYLDDLWNGNRTAAAL